MTAAARPKRPPSPKLLAERTAQAAPFVQAFVRAFEHAGAAAAPAWLAALRQAGLAAFRAQGFPTPALEAWRFTNLRALADAQLAPAGDPIAATLPPALAALTPRATFVNGRFAAALSDLAGLPAGVTLTPLAEATARDGDALRTRIGKLVPAEGDGLAALNAAFLADGAVLSVAAGTLATAPLHLVMLGTAPAPLSFHPRLLVSLGAQAQATIVEHQAGAAGQPYLANQVCEIDVAAGARLAWITHQDHAPGAFAVARMAAAVARDASFRHVLLATGALLSRHEVRIRLDGPGASTGIHAAGLLRGAALADITTAIEHAAPHTTSDEIVKLVLDGRSRGVFQGRIAVAPGAQKIEGYQLSRGLLLSEDATANLKPELEIFADDVKCSHGSTVGQVDPAQLFYLRARGIDPTTARRLLVEGFVGEILEKVPDDETRARLAAQAAAWLAG
ncbi:MAG: Fe-S cluster assembly protein SufD [Alphaproteobacteria bacterium]|nr:Fe-S cluster assembly protein SufD [Alphaproteobacteria bacterium]